MRRSHRVYDIAKRVGDIVLSLALLVIVSPVLAIAAVMVHRELGSPILFRQLRPGRCGRLFTILKFRTMLSALGDNDATHTVASDGERLTSLGRFLRSTSIDELPELWNVLVGDMSIVGPRPLLPEYLDRYTVFQARRHEVRPGITGWAQIHGRNATTWEERFEMDVYYVDNRSFFLDARILIGTVNTVLKREGISAPGVATMKPFMPTRGEASDEEKR